MNETGIYTATELKEMAMNRILENNRSLILDIMSELLAAAHCGNTDSIIEYTKLNEVDEVDKADIMAFLRYKGFKVTEVENYLFVEF